MKRLSVGWFVVVLVWLSACAASPPASLLDAGVAPAAPPADAVPAQDFSYQGWSGHPLAQPIPDVFRYDIARLRADPRYDAVAAEVRAYLHGELSLAEFRAMLGGLWRATDRIADPRLAAAVRQLLRTGDVVDGAAGSGGLMLKLTGCGFRMDRFKRLVAADLEPGDPPSEVKGYGRADDDPRLTIPFVGRRGDERFAFCSEADAWIVAAVCDVVDLCALANLGLGELARDLHRNRVAWENRIDHGYPQYPWEDLVNGWLVSSAWDRAPSRQYIVCHPEPGVLLDIGSASTAAVEPALLLHGLGHLWYPDDERSWFIGASATAALSSDERHGFGYGVTLHLGQSTAAATLPHVAIGLLWHDGVGADERGFEVSIGVDLLRLLR